MKKNYSFNFLFIPYNKTEYASALTGNIIVNTRPVLIWGFSLLIGWETF
jgi:hypothetical protein